MTVDMLMTVAALIGAATALYVAWRKTPAERREIDSSAAERYEQITIRQADRIEMLEKRLSDIETQMSVLEQENADLRDWAERLVHQVQSLGQEPVKIKKRSVATS